MFKIETSDEQKTAKRYYICSENYSKKRFLVKKFQKRKENTLKLKLKKFSGKTHFTLILG
jgi:hypothetical protein